MEKWAIYISWLLFFYWMKAFNIRKKYIFLHFFLIRGLFHGSVRTIFCAPRLISTRGAWLSLAKQYFDVVRNWPWELQVNPKIVPMTALYHWAKKLGWNIYSYKGRNLKDYPDYICIYTNISVLIKQMILKWRSDPLSFAHIFTKHT